MSATMTVDNVFTYHLRGHNIQHQHLQPPSTFHHQPEVDTLLGVIRSNLTCQPRIPAMLVHSNNNYYLPSITALSICLVSNGSAASGKHVLGTCPIPISSIVGNFSILSVID